MDKFFFYDQNNFRRNVSSGCLQKLCPTHRVWERIHQKRNAQLSSLFLSHLPFCNGACNERVYTTYWVRSSLYLHLRLASLLRRGRSRRWLGRGGRERLRIDLPLPLLLKVLIPFPRPLMISGIFLAPKSMTTISSIRTQVRWGSSTIGLLLIGGSRRLIECVDCPLIFNPGIMLRP